MFGRNLGGVCMPAFTTKFPQQKNGVRSACISMFFRTNFTGRVPARYYKISAQKMGSVPLVFLCVLEPVLQEEYQRTVNFVYLLIDFLNYWFLQQKAKQNGKAKRKSTTAKQNGKAYKNKLQQKTYKNKLQHLVVAAPQKCRALLLHTPVPKSPAGIPQLTRRSQKKTCAVPRSAGPQRHSGGSGRRPFRLTRLQSFCPGSPKQKLRAAAI